MFETAELHFNVDHGYLEGLVRGCKASLLTQQDYVNIVQCETLEDLKIHLQTTEYGNFLANETNPLTVSKIDTEMRKKLCREFEYFHNHSLEPLSTFLTYMTCSYMIDNIILLMNGALQKKSVKEVLAKCHPLGRFTEMEAVNIAETPSDLFKAVLVETPLAPFFQDCMSESTLDELNIELLRNKLYKSYLEAFCKFCKDHGDVTAEIMCPILEFEADRRALIITLNSFGTELSKEDRETLFPTCGKLFPEGLRLLAQAEDFEQVKRVADNYGVAAGERPWKMFSMSERRPKNRTHSVHVSRLRGCECGKAGPATCLPWDGIPQLPSSSQTLSPLADGRDGPVQYKGPASCLDSTTKLVLMVGAVALDELAGIVLESLPGGVSAGELAS